MASQKEKDLQEQLDKANASFVELTKENELLKSDDAIGKLTAALDEKAVELSTANEKLQAAEEKIASLSADLTEKNTALEDALNINQDLTAEIEKLSAGDGSKKAETKVVAADHNKLSFEHDGVTIGFNYPKTTLGKDKINAEQIAASPELQQKLIEMKHGILKFPA